MRYLILAAFALAVIGCGTDSDKTSDEKTALSDALPKDFDTEGLSIDGPGGTVTLGDDLETAQTAFPAPDGAITSDTVMNLAILGLDGWSWADEADGSGFEVGIEQGRIVALIRTRLRMQVTEDDIWAQRTEHGTPTAEASGGNATMLVWENGDYARFYLALLDDATFFGPGSFTIIGPKEELILLGYHYDNPQLMLDQLDAIPGTTFD